MARLRHSDVMSRLVLRVKMTGIDRWRMRIGKAFLRLAVWAMGCGVQFDETGDR